MLKQIIRIIAFYSLLSTFAFHGSEARIFDTIHSARGIIKLTYAAPIEEIILDIYPYSESIENNIKEMKIDGISIQSTQKLDCYGWQTLQVTVWVDSHKVNCLFSDVEEMIIRAIPDIEDIYRVAINHLL